MPKIGPDDDGDGGGLRVGIAVSKQRRQIMLTFGDVAVSWVASPPEGMRVFAATLRQTVIKNFGIMRYDNSTLPFKVEAKHHQRMIEIILPQPATMLIGNPELWLTLADLIEQRIASLRYH